MQDLIQLFGFDPQITPDKIGNHHLYLYVQAAVRLGVNYKVVQKGNTVFFRKGNISWLQKKALTPVNSSVGADIAKRKYQCSEVLRKIGIKTPRHQKAYSVEELKDIYQKFNQSIVTKPLHGVGGKGITILPNKDELEEAFAFARRSNFKHVIVEEFVKGDNYRLLVLEDNVIAAAKRVSAFVVGNGKDSINVLITQKNNQRKKGQLPLIVVDQEVHRKLENDGIYLDFVPKEGKMVQLRYNCNLSTGGITVECTDIVAKEYKEIAIKACKYLGLKVAGVDLITPDIEHFTDKYAINEINHNPGLRIHYFPTKGRPIDVAYGIMKYIIKWHQAIKNI